MLPNETCGWDGGLNQWKKCHMLFNWFLRTPAWKPQKMTAAVKHVEMSKTLSGNLLGSEIGIERPISDRRTVVAGLNFINVLCTAFTLVDPKSVKRHWWLNCIFYAFWIYERKSCTQNVDEIDTWCRKIDFDPIFNAGTFNVKSQR